MRLRDIVRGIVPNMMPDSEPHRHPHQTGHKWLDLTLALSAMAVSVISLIVAIIHGRVMERMADANARLVAANSWPFIAYTTSNVQPAGDPQTVTMSLVNDGIGPAKIETFELKWRNVAYSDANKFLIACCGYRPGEGLSVGIVSGQVVRAGENIDFITLPQNSASQATWQALNRIRSSKDLKLTICYCSVFDECWISDVARYSLKPRPVAYCAAPRTPFTLPAGMR